MKKVSIIFLAVITLASCKDKELVQEVELLRSKNQQLVSEISEQDSVFVSAMEEFNQISLNLMEIREREQNIELGNGDRANMDVDARQRISEDIQVINSLMEQNREKIAELDEKLKGSWYQNSKLKKSIAALKEDYEVQLSSRDSSIAMLKTELESMDFTIQDLNGKLEEMALANALQDSMLTEKATMIAEQTTELNTAYYATGSSKELIKNNVVVKDGGFLGIGKSAQINSDASVQAFNKINITETRSIPISGKKAELITAHPNGSYKIEAEDGGKALSSLVILDPEKFWETSKYLVVKVD
ncbi:hypothetical protein R9C00_22515 [Flammeovirgaceae bacterium SG7u.111]|nr:hypothetical protein [Flammeovirgaceae bacterium SG7u.132]WPO34478.1 hypothetical protein R9C00_22515 [Flammeovirgaceae bacterium SG7u.111]